MSVTAYNRYRYIITNYITVCNEVQRYVYMYIMFVYPSQCFGSVTAIISGALSLANKTTPNQNTVLQPMNVLPPMQQQMVMYSTPNRPPAHNEMNMSLNPYAIPYGQPMRSQQPTFMGTYDESIPNEKQNEHVPGQNPTSSKDFSQEVSIHVEN